MMKKILISWLTVIILLGAGNHAIQAEVKEEKLEGTITISGAWALYPMAVKWAEEFQKLHPKVKIDVAAGGAGKGMTDALAQAVDMGMVSREIYPAEIEKGAWWISVAKDAVVATVNENNPVLKDLISKGVGRKTLISIWVTGEAKDWKDITGVTGRISKKTEFHVYTRSDACGAAQTWAEFLGKKQEDLLGVGVYGDPGLAEAVKKDILGIGYNNINYAYDTRSKKQIKGIRILPIDLNHNGQIDGEENFYDNRDEIAQAIAKGEYPSPPARDLHFVACGLPKRKAVVEFIKWVLTSGQKYVPESGYINLTEEKLLEGLRKLEGE